MYPKPELNHILEELDASHGRVGERIVKFSDVQIQRWKEGCIILEGPNWVLAIRFNISFDVADSLTNVGTSSVFSSGWRMVPAQQEFVKTRDER